MAKPEEREPIKSEEIDDSDEWIPSSSKKKEKRKEVSPPPGFEAPPPQSKPVSAPISPPSSVAETFSDEAWPELKPNTQLVTTERYFTVITLLEFVIRPVILSDPHFSSPLTESDGKQSPKADLEQFDEFDEIVQEEVLPEAETQPEVDQLDILTQNSFGLTFLVPDDGENSTDDEQKFTAPVGVELNFTTVDLVPPENIFQNPDFVITNLADIEGDDYVIKRQFDQDHINIIHYHTNGKQSNIRFEP